MSLVDGFYDIDELNIEVQYNWLDKVYPNPVHSIMNVDYVIEQGSNAYLMIADAYGLTSNNYIVSANSGSTQIDMTNYVPGIYNLILIVDGLAQDAFSISVQ